MLHPADTERAAHALGLEKLSLAKEAEEINEESRRLEEQAANELASRGVLQSGMFAGRIATIHQNRAKRMVDTQIELRRVTLRSAPELASDEKFKAPLDSTNATIDRVLASIPEHLRRRGFHVSIDAVHPRDEQMARSLKAHAQREIEILKHRNGLETIKDKEGRPKTEIMAAQSPKLFFPTAQELIHADLERRGRILLILLKSYEGLGGVHQQPGGFNRDYFFADMEGVNKYLGKAPRGPDYGPEQPRVLMAFREAWGLRKKAA